uniref:Uncharacterized protein n=1 Tax=Arundo donax TaxID=35708 RepID=A0A0A8ZXT9_ARUDO
MFQSPIIVTNNTSQHKKHKEAHEQYCITPYLQIMIHIGFSSFSKCVVGGNGLILF